MPKCDDDQKKVFMGITIFLVQIRQKTYGGQIGNHIFCVVWCKFHTSTASSLRDMRKSIKMTSSLLGASQDDVIIKNNVKFVISVKNPIRKKGSRKKCESGEIMKQPRPSVAYETRKAVNIAI